MTTTTDLDQPYCESDHYKEGRAWLDGQGPLPDAETLAGPLVKALYDVWATFAERAETMAFGIEQGEFIDEARQLVATAERVASLAAAIVDRCVVGSQTAQAAAAHGVVVAVAGTHDVVSELHHAQLDRFCYGD